MCIIYRVQKKDTNMKKNEQSGFKREKKKRAARI